MPNPNPLGGTVALPFQVWADWDGVQPVLPSMEIVAAIPNNLQTLLYSRGIDVDGLGAHGDGDSGSPHDDTTLIQNAITLASAQGGGTVLLGPRTYQITGTLLLPQNVALRGVSKYSSILRYTGAGRAVALTNGQAGTPSLTTGAQIDNLQILGTGNATIGLDLTASQDGSFTNLLITGFTNQGNSSVGIGIRLVGVHQTSPTFSTTCQNNKFANVSITNCHIAADLGTADPAQTDSNVQLNDFVNCQFTGTATASTMFCGVLLRERAVKNSFTNCVFLYAQAGGKLVEVRDDENTFTSCIGAQSLGGGVDFLAGSTTAPSANTWSGGSLDQTTITANPAWNDSLSVNSRFGQGTGSGTSLSSFSGTILGNLNVNGTISVTGSVTAPLQDHGGQVFNVKAYGAKGDFKLLQNVVIATGIGLDAGFLTATSTTSVFTAADTGKLFYWYYGGSPGPQRGTIAHVNSATVVRIAGFTAPQTGTATDAIYGTQDDTAAFLQAYAGAYAQAGGAIYIPPGIYVVSTLPYTDQIVWYGAGSASRLTQLPTTAAPLFVRDPNDTRAPAPAYIFAATWRDFLIDSRYNQQNTGGIYLQGGIQNRIIRMGIEDFWNFGIRSLPLANEAGGGSQDLLIQDCRIMLANNFYGLNYVSHAIWLSCVLNSAPDGATITGTHIHSFANANAIRAGKNGNLEGGPGGWYVAGNRFYGADYGRSDATYTRTVDTQVPPKATNPCEFLHVDISTSSIVGNRGEYNANGNQVVTIGDGSHDDQGNAVSPTFWNSGGNLFYANSWSASWNDGTRGLRVTDLGGQQSEWDFLSYDVTIRAGALLESSGLLRIHPASWRTGPGTGGSVGALLHIDGRGSGSSGAAFGVTDNGSVSFYLIDAPTLTGSGGARTTQVATTLRVNGPPVAGTNSTIITAAALSLGGTLYFDGVYSSPTAAPLIYFNPNLTMTSGVYQEVQYNAFFMAGPAATVSGTAQSTVAALYPAANPTPPPLTLPTYTAGSITAAQFSVQNNGGVSVANGGPSLPFSTSELRGIFLSVATADASRTTNSHGIWIGAPGHAGTGQTDSIRGLLLQSQRNLAAVGTPNNGGLLAYGIELDLPNQGGNTAGTNVNWGLAIQGVGGTPGSSGGAVQNWALTQDTVTGASGPWNAFAANTRFGPFTTFYPNPPFSPIPAATVDIIGSGSVPVLSAVGGAISLNHNSNFNTVINDGSSTGSVTIGNTLAGPISVQSAGPVSVQAAGLITITPSTTLTGFIGGDGLVQGAVIDIGPATYGTTRTIASDDVIFVRIAQPTVVGSGGARVNHAAFTMRIDGPPIIGANITLDQVFALSLGGSLHLNGHYTDAIAKQACIEIDPILTFTSATPSFTQVDVEGQFNVGTGATFSGSALSTNVSLFSGSIVAGGLTSQFANVYNRSGGSVAQFIGLETQLGLTNNDSAGPPLTPSKVGSAYSIFVTSPSFAVDGQGRAPVAGTDIGNSYGIFVQAQRNAITTTTPNGGGYVSYGIYLQPSNQGGSVSPTVPDTNHGLFLDVGGGSSAAGGLVVNYAVRINVPNPVSVATGTNTNIALSLTGAGGTGPGTDNNWTIFSDATPDAAIRGNVLIGNTVTTPANTPAAAFALDVRGTAGISGALTLTGGASVTGGATSISGGPISLNGTAGTVGLITIGNTTSTTAVNIAAAAASSITVAGGNLTLQTTTSGTIALVAAGTLTATATGNSSLAITNGNLTLSTVTTGNLTLTAAQQIAITGVGNSGITITSGNLTLSTVTAGTLALSSATNLIFTPATGSTTGNGLTTGVFGAFAAGTYTAQDTGNTAFWAFAIPTLANSNLASTTATASTVYIAGPPTAGTNETITGAYALNVNGPMLLTPSIGATGVQSALTFNPTTLGNSGAPTALAMFVSAIPPGPAAAVSPTGIAATVTLANSQGTTGAVVGVSVIAGNASTGIVGEARGVFGRLQASGASGAVNFGSILRAFSPIIAGTSTITPIHAIFIDGQFNTLGATATTGSFVAAGIWLNIPTQTLTGGGGTAANYGLRIAGVGGVAGIGGTTVTNYGLYQDTTSTGNGPINIIAGNTRFGGLTAPVATLDVTGTIAATLLITGSAGLNVTGAVVNLNVAQAFDVNVLTGASGIGNLHLGDGTGTGTIAVGNTATPLQTHTSQRFAFALGTSAAAAETLAGGSFAITAGTTTINTSAADTAVLGIFGTTPPVISGTQTAPNAYSVFIGGPPTAAGGATLTNTWSLGVNGAVRILTGGLTVVAGGLTVTAGSLTLTAGGIAATGNSSVAGTLTVTSNSATALAVGRQGATNPALQVDASTATQLTGLLVKAAGTGGGLALSVIEAGGTNNPLTIDAMGTGTLTLNGTATGAITLARSTAVAGTLTVTATVAAAFAIGPAGATNPTFQVSAAGAPQNGLSITGGPSGGGVTIAAISQGLADSLRFTAKSATNSLILNDTLAAATNPLLVAAATDTITGAVGDAFTSGLRLSPSLSGAFTVSRLNYFDIIQPTGSSTITDAPLFRFSAGAGIHKSVDGPTTKTTPGGVDGWIKINLSGILAFIPVYLSKTT